MYWTDFGAAKIQRANLDGSGVEDLVTSGLSNPFDIALDVSGGKMYWTDGVKIQRANLDGSSVEDLITTGLSLPVGITLNEPLTAGPTPTAAPMTPTPAPAPVGGAVELVTGASDSPDAQRSGGGHERELAALAVALAAVAGVSWHRLRRRAG